METTVYTTLISTQELAHHLSDPNWVIVDCRFDLSDKEWGEEEYQQLHIPGAVYAHQERDLCGEITPLTGRHPLPVPADFIQAMRRLGISNAQQVVVYDSTGGGMAARLWFLLKYYGHEAVALLDGCLPAWLSEGRPISEGSETRPAGNFEGGPVDGMVVFADEVKAMLHEPQRVLIDSRAPERYRGEVEPIDPVAGRIPGARNRFYGDNLDASAHFRPAEELRAAFLKVFNGLPAQDVVFYCGSGTTACHNLLAAAYAGLPMPRIYIGSWSEWIRDPSHPVEKG